MMRAEEIFKVIAEGDVEAPIGTKTFVVIMVDGQNRLTSAGTMVPECVPLVAWHLLGQLYAPKKPQVNLAKPRRKGGPKAAPQPLDCDEEV